MLLFVIRRGENMLLITMMSFNLGKDRVWVEAQRLRVNSMGRPFGLHWLRLYLLMHTYLYPPWVGPCHWLGYPLVISCGALKEGKASIDDIQLT